MSSARGALSGVRVIDLSRVLGGPYCTQALGDHGADVIKIEPPRGDETRDWGPPFQDDTASYFLGVNRNKRGMALDLRAPEGRTLLLRLLDEADVLVENFKPGTLENWGLGYDVLHAHNPRLIHCRISGFGSDGPLGGLPGYDSIAQAMAGLMSVNGAAGSEPLRVGLPIVDMVAGMNAVIGITMALHERERSGLGQLVEATLFDSGLALMHPHFPNMFAGGPPPRRTGNAHPNIAPYELFRTGTQPIFVAAGNNTQFRKLCDALGHSELADEPRFADNGSRLQNRAALRDALERALAEHDGPQVAQRLIRSGVPCGPVLETAEVLDHPHTRHRGMLVKIDDYQGTGAPIKLGRTPPSYLRPPPAFAQHTDEILGDAGLSAQEIADLRAGGVIPQVRS